MRSIKKLIFIVLILVFSTNVIAQNTTTKLTTKEQKAAIDSISKKLLSIYIFPEVAKKMSTSIQSNFKKNKYKSILDPQEFAFVLTKNLQEISKDLHLNVSFDPTGILERKKAITTKDSLILLNNYIDSLKENNFGFKEIKILDGNIGYLDLRIFAETEYGGETAISAMNFLSNTNTIIIDLRNNGGGDPGMIQLISSYLFDGPPVHLNNFYWRSNDSTTQTWTLPYVPGKKSPNKPNSNR